MLLFWIGGVLTLLIALVYTAILVTPQVPVPQGMDPAQVRSLALGVALGAAALFAVQVVAAVGLTLGRPWARTPATIACIGWALTCAGLPVAVLALTRIWRR